jgi:3-methyladenine DNA glycosylase Tag
MKIESVRNARAFLKIQEEFGNFDSYGWRFVDGRSKLNRWKTTRQIPANSSAFFRVMIRPRHINVMTSRVKR